MSQALTAFFRKVELFRALDDADLGELLRAIRPVEVAAGEIIFREGDAGDAAYAIHRGRVEILVGRDEAEVQVAELGPGAVLGELALLDGSARSATARAATDVSLFRIDQGEFDFLRRNMRPAAYKVIRSISFALCERLRDTNARMRDLMSTPPGAPPPPPLDPAPARSVKVTSARRRPEDERRDGDTGGVGLLGRLNFWSNR